MTELPAEIVEKIEAVGMLESIPLWIVTLLGSLLITVLSFIMILTVYGRMFKLYMYTAIAPIPISTFAGEPSQSVGKNFIKSYAGVCLEGAIIALACIIFSVYSASPPMYTAIAPIPISTFAGEPSQSVGKNFIKSYAGVCLEGAIIALACIIFSVYSASPPAGVSGRGDHCTGLYHFLCLFCQSASHWGYVLKCSDHCVELSRGIGVQPAGAGGCGERI